MPHPDVRASAVPCKGPWARAGGRGRFPATPSPRFDQEKARREINGKPTGR
jgi:hypothetical protein